MLILRAKLIIIYKISKPFATRPFNIAKEILLRTDEPILDICFKTGFLNESYFIRQFKKRCGTTPKQFRMKTRIQSN